MRKGFAKQVEGWNIGVLKDDECYDMMGRIHMAIMALALCAAVSARDILTRGAALIYSNGQSSLLFIFATRDRIFMGR